MNRNTGDNLTPRKLQVLSAIVEAYVATGDPVGSKSISDRLGVSSATIRNEMAALSQGGYLEQPHTSAGRIPSERGYRMYVDRLMEDATISPEEQLQLDQMLMLDAYEPEKLLENVSQILASITRFAALSTTPAGSDGVIRGVQFVQTGRRTAMAILMTSAGTMKTRVFKCDFDLTPDMMRIFFRVLNERLAGRPLSSITPAFVQGLAASLGELAILLSSALMAVLELAKESMETEIRLNGQMNLLFYPEFDSGRARRVMDFLESRQLLCKLLFDEGVPSVRRGHVRVLIGSESHRPELQDSSILIARYDVAGRPSGAIGILGPTRMDYRSLIAHLDYLSTSVGRMLTELMKEE
jgi:heat-inducible transcriptional repressor